MALSRVLLAALENAHLFVESGDSFFEATYVLVAAIRPYVLKGHIFDSGLSAAGSGGRARGRRLRLILVAFACRIEPRVFALVLSADLGSSEVLLVIKVGVDVERQRSGRTVTRRWGRSGDAAHAEGGAARACRE
eukprot:2796672-Pleurochrysis_carterae.AAC.1